MDNLDNRSVYKKRTLFLLLITVTALVVCAAALSFKQSLAQVSGIPLEQDSAQSQPVYYSSNAVVSQENSGIRKDSAEKNFNEPAGGYLITVYEGKIGVFESGRTSSPPFLTADVNVYLLPDEDITLLKKGLRVETLAEVRAVLEDYR